jgi:hypothetical protein
MLSRAIRGPAVSFPAALAAAIRSPVRRISARRAWRAASPGRMSGVPSSTGVSAGNNPFGMTAAGAFASEATGVGVWTGGVAVAGDCGHEGWPESRLTPPGRLVAQFLVEPESERLVGDPNAQPAQPFGERLDRGAFAAQPQQFLPMRRELQRDRSPWPACLRDQFRQSGSLLGREIGARLWCSRSDVRKVLGFARECNGTALGEV